MAFADFVHSVLEVLPSSSSIGSTASAHASVLGELLVDLIWSADAKLDEILADAKALIATTEPAAQEGKSTANNAKIVELKQNAEIDKELVQQVVRKLVVSSVRHPSFPSHSTHCRTLVWSIPPSAENDWTLPY